MKIWLHFSKLLEPYKTPENSQEVVDVQISNSTLPKYFLLMKMQEFQTQINEVNSKINSGALSYKELALFDKDLAKLKVKIFRFKEKYDLIMEVETQ